MLGLDLFIAGAALFLGFFAGVIVCYSFSAHELRVISLARLSLVIVVILAGTAYYRDLTCQRTYNSITAQSIVIGRQAQIDLIREQISILDRGVTDPKEQEKYKQRARELLETYRAYPIPTEICS
jgi:hypothetical protein